MKSIKFLAAASAMALAMPAHAVELYSLTDTGQISGSTGPSFSANSGGGAGNLSFYLNGYLSLDGDGNCCSDTFTLTINGADVLSLSYNLGGGGNNVIYTNLLGATVTGGDPNGSGPDWNGGQAFVSVPLTLLAGSNTFDFNFSPTLQGAGDEAWGISKLSLNGAAPGAVPEPATWAMMLAGFGLMGAAMRRKHNVSVRFA
jgi:hypothetical protein